MKRFGHDWCQGYKQALFHVLFIGIVFFSMNRAFSQGACGKVSMADEILTMVPDFPEYMLNDSTGVLCGGVGFNLRYGPDFEYTDPVPSTPSGLRVLVFKSRPDIDGWVDLDQLRDHPDILKDEDGEPLIVGTDSSYRIAYEGLWEYPFGLVYPSGIWLVPVIVHNADPVPGTSHFENEDCIFIRTSKLFSIIMVNSAGPDVRSLTYDRKLEQFIFTLKDGLPEYDPDRFDYYVEVVNTVTGESLDLIRYSHKVFGFRPIGLKGIYTISSGNAIGPGCGGSIVGLPLSVPQPMISIPDTISYTGEEVCLQLTIREFVDIDSFFFSLEWDPDILKFKGIAGIEEGPFTAGNFFSEHYQGRLAVSWTDGGHPVTLPDGAGLFDLCFTVIGKNGDIAPVITVGQDDQFYIGDDFLEPRVKTGSVRIVPDNFIDFSYTVIDCSKGPNDRVNVLFSIVGKNPPFTVSFDPFNLGNLPMESHRDTLFLIPEDTYTITVTDEAGASVSRVDQVIEDGGEVIRFSIDENQTRSPLCHGANTGQIALDLYPDPGPVTIGYYRTGGDTMTTGDVLISGLEAGEYHVWVENSEGCGGDVVRTIELVDPSKLSIEVEDRELNCEDSMILIHFLEEVEGGSGRIEYSLDGVTFRNVTSDTILTAGEYSVDISDENRCTASADFEIRPSTLEPSFTFDVVGDSLHVEPGEVFGIIANVNSVDPELKYEWQESGGEMVESDKNQAQFVFKTDGIIELTITDPFGCEYSDQLPVIILKDEKPGDGDNDDDNDSKCTVSIPNAVSPNGDGINDHLEVFSDCDIQVTDIRLFDKWGGELYHVQGNKVKAQIWEELTPGVVMVQVRYEDPTGRTKWEAGAVMVVR